MRAIPLLLVWLAVGGCDRLGAEAHAPIKAIEYSTSPCFGRCPVYSVTVTASGAGTFVGTADTTVKGRRDFHISPDTFQAFARTLEPLRPRKGNRNLTSCVHEWTDNPGADVSWIFADGTRQSASVYFGCSGDYPNAARVMIAAPGKLPIADFVSGAKPDQGKR
jgi:hypothetical protein